MLAAFPPVNPAFALSIKGLQTRGENRALQQSGDIRQLCRFIRYAGSDAG